MKAFTLDQNQVQRLKCGELKTNLDIFHGMNVPDSHKIPAEKINFMNFNPNTDKDNEKSHYEAIKKTTRRVLEGVQYIPQRQPTKNTEESPLGNNIFMSGLDFMERESMRRRPANNFTLQSPPDRDDVKRMLYEENVPRERSLSKEQINELNKYSQKVEDAQKIKTYNLEDFNHNKTVSFANGTVGNRSKYQSDIFKPSGATTLPIMVNSRYN